MSKQQAWTDHDRLYARSEQADAALKALGNILGDFITLYAEIYNDIPRRTELIALLNVSPLLTLAQLADKKTEYLAAQNWLSEHGYI